MSVSSVVLTPGVVYFIFFRLKEIFTFKPLKEHLVYRRESLSVYQYCLASSNLMKEDYVIISYTKSVVALLVL